MVKPVSVCVPVLRRYDLFHQLLCSLANSDTEIDAVYVVDNGRDSARLNAAVEGVVDVPPVLVHTPVVPMGVAESWNWFISNVKEERIIANDDIRFYPESLHAFVSTPGDVLYGKHGFSCFIIRDSCVEKVGLFDESISPGYAYWEDIDYIQHLELIVPTPVQVLVNCRLDHGGSKTNEVITPEQTQEHHRRFILAKNNFLQKWGQLPRELMHPAIHGWLPPVSV